MNNFPKKLECYTEEELKTGLDIHSPEYAQLESDELTRRYLRGLRKSIRIFNSKSSGQTEKMIKLTKWIVILTIIMICGLVIQIYLAIN